MLSTAGSNPHQDEYDTDASPIINVYHHISILLTVERRKRAEAE